MTVMSGPTFLPGAQAILVVDDVGVRRQAYRVLSGAGYRVLEATTRREAEDVLASTGNRLSLVIVDVTLASYHGMELCEQLRSGHSSISLLLAVPGGAELDPRRLAAAKVAVVPKPFSPEDLLGIVKGALGGDGA